MRACSGQRTAGRPNLPQTPTPSSRTRCTGGVRGQASAYLIPPPSPRMVERTRHSRPRARGGRLLCFVMFSKAAAPRHNMQHCRSRQVVSVRIGMVAATLSLPAQGSCRHSGSAEMRERDPELQGACQNAQGGKQLVGSSRASHARLGAKFLMRGQREMEGGLRTRAQPRVESKMMARML